MDTAELFRWILDNLDYWVVTFFMIIESSFIPFPSEVVVPPAAWKAMADGSMNIVLVVVFATIGANIGALVNYYLARWLGRPIVYRFANSRIGHMCLLDGSKRRKTSTSWPRNTATKSVTSYSAWPSSLSPSSSTKAGNKPRPSTEKNTVPATPLYGVAGTFRQSACRPV